MITRREQAGAATAHPLEAVFESTDPEVTAAYLTAAVSTTKARGDPDNYRFRHVRFGSGPLYIDTVHQTGTTEYHADPLAGLAVVRIRRGIRTNLELDDDLGPGDLSLHSQPTEPYHARLASVEYTSISVSMQAAADARNRPDDDLGALHFDSLRPVNPAAARRLLCAVDYTAANLRAFPDAMAQPLLAGAATRLLAAVLLTTFPNSWISGPHYQDRTDATPSALSRAIAFIETNADADITVVDIARAAYVTVRAVQLAFRRGLDTTPMAYLRRVRLDRARDQLVAGSPHDGLTISQVAARWGFADPSRFTAQYRAAFGELPSHTLRR
jgi:AraC-like DNA-binding protein